MSRQEHYTKNKKSSKDEKKETFRIAVDISDPANFAASRTRAYGEQEAQLRADRCSNSGHFFWRFMMADP